MKRFSTMCVIGLFAVLLLYPGTDFAAPGGKQVSISGRVTDESGEPLVGVTVLVKGTATGTTTNNDGRYLIKVQSGEVLHFSYLGYKDFETRVDASVSTLDIRMTAAMHSINEVVVTGYGTQSRRTLTSAITKIGGSEVQRTPVNSVGDALKGKIAGVRVYSPDNAAGSEVSIVVRGGSSIEGGDSPLIIIDGMEREDLSSVNPNDIASIEVLKDAASAAIYGSRASNGVVLVTTKSASYNTTPTITFESSIAYQDITNEFEFLDGGSAITYARKRMSKGASVIVQELWADHSAYSSGNTLASRYTTRYLQEGEAIPAGYKSVVDPLDPSKRLIYQDNDWVHIFFPTQVWQNYYAGIEGGGQRVSYTGSIGYTIDSGSCVGTGSDKLTARMKTDLKISDKLRFQAGFNFTQQITDLIDNQYERLSRGFITPATMRLYWEEGEWAGQPMVYENNVINALYYSYYWDNVSRNNVLSLNGSLTWDILPGLKAALNAQMWKRTYATETFERAHYVDSTRESTASNLDVQRNKLWATLAYNKTFGGVHHISATAGYETMYENNYYMYAATAGSGSDDIPTMNAGVERTSTSSRRTYDVTMGYFGRFQYDYRQKYLFSFVFRTDGSSRFNSGYQWGFFPGASAGWVLSEEPFLRGVRQIDLLKLRVSYGQTGNNAVGLYDAKGLYNFGTQYDGEASVLPSTLANDRLRWETTTQLDLGLDVSLLEGRISFAVDYFNKITDDLLQSITLPNTSGYSSVKTNLGQVRYRGFDLEIHTRNIETKHFSWRSDFTWSYVKNRVVKLPNNGVKCNRVGGYTVPMYDADGNLTHYVSFGGIAEGEPLGRIYGYKEAYIISTQEQAENAHYDPLSSGWDWGKGSSIGTGKKAIGDYEWCDLNGDGVINSYDMYCLGNTIPHSTGGFGNTFTYKNLSLNIYFDWALGHSINNRNFTWYMADVWRNGSLPVQVLDSYDPESGGDASQAKYATWTPADSNKNYHRDCSSVSVQKADYLCLREVSLSYTLRSPKLRKVGIQSLGFTLAGNNLHYFTDVIGLSPEFGTSASFSSSFKSHPAVRRVSLGVKVTF